MATFTNTSGEDRSIPLHNLFIAAGDDFTVPDEDTDGLRAQPWCVEKTGKKSETVAAPVAVVEPVTVPVDAEQGVI